MSEPRRLTPTLIGGYAPAISPDGRLSIHPDGQSIRLFETDTGKERPRIIADRAFFNSTLLTASPLGRYMANINAGGEQRLQIWSATDGKPRLTLTFPGDQAFFPRLLAFSPDTRLLAAVGNNNSIRVWEPATGAL